MRLRPASRPRRARAGSRFMSGSRCGRAAAAGYLAAAGNRGDDQAPLIPVRVDGKTVRGARNPDGTQVHLLAALAGQPGVVAAQTEVGAKTNEIPMIIPLLDGLDLAGTVITADALHCQRATADYLHRRGADFILPIVILSFRVSWACDLRCLAEDGVFGETGAA